jgi:hypothetical protein
MILMPLEEDIRLRAKAQRSKIIEALREAGVKGLTNVYLYDNITKSLGARLTELYERGYYIQCTKVKDGVYNYVLIAEPIKPQPKPKRAEDLLIEQIETKYNGTIDVQHLINLLRENDLIISRKAGAFKRKLAQ